MAWRFEGRLEVVVHSAQSPSNLEWMRFLNEAKDHGEGNAVRVLVVSHGGGPDGEQRKQLTRAMGTQTSPTVVMTKSGIVRAIVSALTFFNRGMHAIELHDFAKARELLGLTASESARAQQLCAELEAQLQTQARGGAH